ncbi:I78 family peptidase inhibitor [Sphingomonas fuzhouensis]|uniref:I78 family peptidase inhibitor n=1 Tax=Sphingomonas fuzhouensis TaxID=3106033 RepID=UPI002AFF5BC8|nr:I78 family peptidase inhibitor [Sphingomonas sp. SGZ-02]
MRRLILLAMLPLTACTTMPKAEEQMAMTGCGDAKVADLIGKAWTEALRAPTVKRTGARSLRVIAPGDAVTMDYRPDRLNIETDAAGRVVRLKCG